MAKAPSIRVEDIELDGDVRLWDVMHAALAAKESQPRASLLPVSTCTGIRKISLNWYDALLMR